MTLKIYGASIDEKCGKLIKFGNMFSMRKVSILYPDDKNLARGKCFAMHLCQRWYSYGNTARDEIWFGEELKQSIPDVLSYENNCELLKLIFRE